MPNILFITPLMPLIWTDDDGFVTRIHYRPSMVDDANRQDSEYVSSIPSSPGDLSENEARKNLYYSDELGIRYV
ncbi:hypothetical protein BN903_61 [Halorubrum sp. AJ67]|nr:hypothetical protein BN903_61 [Halorubrum sp. AJ67]